MYNRFVLLVSILSCSLACGRAEAYYDDVHYALTYYICRQTGYTALQSYRIASACSEIDWDPETEPVQALDQALYAMPAAELAKLVAEKAVDTLFLSLDKLPNWNTGVVHKVRFRFHAMRNNGKYEHCVANQEDAITAQAEVMAELETMFKEALEKSKNPGAFLHALQDVEPHRGYGTGWGHWPIYPGGADEYRKLGLAVGGTPDWVAVRTFDVGLMVEQCMDRLRIFMNKVSPHQLWRLHKPVEYDSLIRALAAANKPPASLDTEFKRSQFVQFYAAVKANMRTTGSAFADPNEVEKLAQQLGVGLSKYDFMAHKDGPKIPDAIRIVQSELLKRGLQDDIPIKGIKYDYDRNGFLANEEQLDSWVLVGSLKVTVQGTNPVVATIKMPASGQNAHEYALPGVDPVTMNPGEMHKWEELPVGDLILELKQGSGGIVRKVIKINKRENEVVIKSEDTSSGDWWVCNEPEACGMDVRGKMPKGQFLKPFGADAAGGHFDDPAGTDKGNATWVGVPKAVRKGDTIRLVLTASKMRATFLAPDFGIRGGASHPSDAGRDQAIVEFKFDPPDGVSSVTMQVQASPTMSTAYNTCGVLVVWTFVKGAPPPVDLTPTGPSGSAESDNPGAGAGAKPEHPGGETLPTAPTGPSGPAEGDFSPAGGFSTPKGAVGSVTAAGSSLILAVPSGSDEAVRSFMKTSLVGDTDLRIDYTLESWPISKTAMQSLDIYLCAEPEVSGKDMVQISRSETGGDPMVFAVSGDGDNAIAAPAAGSKEGKFRLVRKGAQWTVYQWRDGKWDALGMLTSDLPTKVYVGFGVGQSKSSGDIRVRLTPTVSK